MDQHGQRGDGVDMSDFMVSRPDLDGPLLVTIHEKICEKTVVITALVDTEDEIEEAKLLLIEALEDQRVQLQALQN